MKNWAWPEWIAWASFILPLIALAWSAVMVVMLRRAEARQHQFERLFKTLDYIGGKDSSIASKVAATYELRRFPEYRDVILRFCEKAEVEGSAAQMLRDDLKLTADYMRKVSRG